MGTRPMVHCYLGARHWYFSVQNRRPIDYNTLATARRLLLPRVMPYVITQKCVGTCDTACVDVCPSDCIIGPIPLDQLRAVPEAERGTRFPGIQMFVDPDECIDCGACVAECPVDAIYLDTDVPDAHRADVGRNADFFREQRARR
jgi:ferredoxin